MATNGNKDPRRTAEADGELEEFRQREKARRRKLGILVITGFLAAATIFTVGVFFSSELFESGIDVEGIEAQITEHTNDPHCRETIADVSSLGEDFFKLEPTIDDKLLGEDAEAIKEIRDEILRMQQRLDEISERSAEANLRYDESRKQLDDWFDFVAVEFGFLSRLANEQLATLKAGEEAELAEEGEEPDGERAKEREEIDEGVVVADGEADEPTEEKASEKTPLERKEGALLAVHESFQQFRIWHTAGAHPCGAAPEGVDPWEPEPAKPAVD